VPQVERTKMKLLLPFALFLVVMSVEGNLRGEHSHADKVPRSLKMCMNMMGGKSNDVAAVDTFCGCPKGRALTIFAIFLALSVAPASCPTDSDPPTVPDDPPTDPDDPDLGRDPGRPYDTCAEETPWQNAQNVVKCSRASDCSKYKPKFGTACCLASRCICGSNMDAGGCAVFDPAELRIGPVTYGPVTVPTAPGFP
jgi:hypothetical protein